MTKFLATAAALPVNAGGAVIGDMSELDTDVE